MATLPTVEKHTDVLTAMLNYTEQSTGADEPYYSIPTSSAEQSTLRLGGHLPKAQSQSKKVLVKLDPSLLKPLLYSSKCGNLKCRKRFTSALKCRRNCNMCGEVFCRDCTNFRRKLSASAKPDPLGMYFNVCELCLFLESECGMSNDLLREFSDHRREILGLKKAAVSCNLRNPLCGQKPSELKYLVLKRELTKLMVGFKQNTGLVQEILAEVKVPAWQKLPQWVDSSKASGCFSCGGTFGVFTGRIKKVNCRVGGQVFCSKCCPDAIVIYCEGQKVKWAINGRPGAPSVKPSIYTLLPICCHCVLDLQEITLQTVTQPDTTVSVYLENIYQMHQKLSKLQSQIETILPKYMMVVDALDMTDNSPRSINERNPLQSLVKIQTDLSDAFSSLAMQSQSLKHLKPEGKTDKKLHSNIMVGVYCYYSENMYQFRLAKCRLSELMPTDQLEEIQLNVSQRSMERVHVYLQQLMFELLDLKLHNAISEKMFELIMESIRCMEEELKLFLKYRNESWEKHAECSVNFVRSELEAGRRTLTLFNSDLCVVMSQISSRLHECYRELQAKTVDREFPSTKQSIHDAVLVLDSLLTQ